MHEGTAKGKTGGREEPQSLLERLRAGDLGVAVIEDDPALAELMRERLSIIGTSASVYYDGTIALPIVLKRNPELVICDVDLPRRDGVSVAEEILNQLERCRVILISGSQLPSAGYKLLTLYPARCSFLQKPFLMEGLIGGMEELLMR